MAASAWMQAGLARVLFYPTLLYTVFRGKVRGPAHRDWYHRIDHTVLLGALPLRGMTHKVSEAARLGLQPLRGLAHPPGEAPGPPRPLLSPLFASAADTGRERARGDHHERGVRDEVPVQLLKGTQLPGGGCKSHFQDPVPHLHQTWPAGNSQ
uniref:Protein tyrosine phosphatase mitochondrial 1 n=1 Tax=Sciurus vulgaris TaxID=55149 RepID=A0A8D2B7P8_SCIVU